MGDELAGKRCAICPHPATALAFGIPVCAYHVDHGEDESCGRCGRGPIVGYRGDVPICAVCVGALVEARRSLRRRHA